MFTLAVSLATAAAAAPPAPVAVSPGDARQVVEIGPVCPTFSWSTAAGAEGFELIVYPLPEAGAEAGQAAAELEPALRQLLPRAVGSWTPGGDDCLEPGREYAWVIRAHGATATVDGAEAAARWSEPRLFRTRGAPTAEELSRALEVVQRFLAISSPDERLSAIGAAADRAPRVDRQHPERGSDERSPRSSAPTLAGAVPAVRAEVADATGETVGLVGVSHSPDGAGVLAANANAAAADLVLDGASHSGADTAMTESALRVGGASFDIGNGTNTLSLTLDGIPLVTTATDQDTTYSDGNQLQLDGTTFNVVESGLNADTVDGQEASDFAASSHDHMGETWSRDSFPAPLAISAPLGPVLSLSTSSHTGGSTEASETVLQALSAGTTGVLGESSSSSGSAAGVRGRHTSSAGLGYGVFGSGASSLGGGVYGEASSATGTTYGVFGKSISISGTGVLGEAAHATGTTTGVSGLNSSTSGSGVRGEASAVSGTTHGVLGVSASSSGTGAKGSATSTTGTTYGVLGESASSSGTGVRGVASSPSGTTWGIWGLSQSTAGTGVMGLANWPAGATTGVHGKSVSTDGRGIFGEASAATGTTIGVRGESISPAGVGVSGYNSATTGEATGVFGRSDAASGSGVYGFSSHIGVRGEGPGSTGRGVYGNTSATTGATRGVHGRSDSQDGTGVHGEASRNSGPNFGVRGTSVSTAGTGVEGDATAASGTTYGVRGQAASVDGYGGYFVNTVSGIGLWGEAEGASGATKGVQGRVSSADGFGGYFTNAGGGVALWAQAGANDTHDLIVAGSGAGGDDGRISSQTDLASSDLILAANDAVVLELDANGGETSRFGVKDDGGTERFQVWESGVVFLKPTDSPGSCTAGGEGSVYFDDSLAEPCYCNGSGWQQFDGGGAC